jgi:molybdopterin-guanine dinucleotide biosynthesis protein A
MLGRVELTVLDWTAEEISPFFNVNTPEDLARAELLQKSGLPGLNAGRNMPT